MTEADGVIAKRSPFNLNGQTIRFVPSPGMLSYGFEVRPDSYDAAAAAAGAQLVDLGDDDSREVPIPFPFPFFGSHHRSVHVNSDGNLTFGKGDVEITERSLGRFLSGPPRIAALLADLDPSRSRSGVRVRAEGGRLVISWVEVPQYQSFGTGPLQSVQIRLHADGTIEIAYSSMEIEEAVVGITPGALKGEPSMVTFKNGSSGQFTSSIVERFSSSRLVDVFAAAQKFYRNHEDAYDLLAIYNTAGVAAGETAVAYEVTVRNNRTGYGDPVTDVGERAGSRKRLQAIVNMGPVNQYPRDPNGKVPARLATGDTALSILAHEFGHLFLAYVSVKDDDGLSPMLGYQSAHWDFKFNSDASLMEGNRIEDKGAGVSPRFLTTAAVEGFSALDQYLMGLRAAEEVPNTFYVRSVRGAALVGLPSVGTAFNGERRDVSIDEIVSQAGRRTPDHTVAQRNFRMAFVLVAPEGQEPTAEQIAQIDSYRTAFEAYFNKVTGGRATVETRLQKSVDVSAFPALGVALGATVPVAIALQEPAAKSITFNIRTSSGLVRAPSVVVAPAGARQLSFNVHGAAAGTDDLIIEPSDSTYEAVTARIQVQPVSKLKLEILTESSPVRIGVMDENRLPYPGVSVSAATTGEGFVDKKIGVSGTDGSVEFRWTQSPATANSLSATLGEGASVTIEAGAVPVFTAAAITNAASYEPGLSPGGIATIFGARLGGENARVLVGGRRAQVLYGGDTQLNFIVPVDMSDGTSDVVVQSGNAVSPPVQVAVRTLQPGIFVVDPAEVVGAVTRAGSWLTTSEDPPGGGDMVSIYLTGLGPVQFRGALAETLARPEVMIGGRVAEIHYSGLAPGFVGLYQINARVPSGLAAGLTKLSVTVAGQRSNEVHIRLRE
jgi:uncharacterized protein (TIGR03437 family)